MTFNKNLGRRSVLGALALSPALALPTAAMEPTLNPQDLIEHHFEGLVRAMSEITVGRWEVRVVSGDADQGLHLRQIGNSKREARYHLSMAYDALEASEPGQWKLNLNVESRGALLVRDDGPLLADDVVGSSALTDCTRERT